MGNINSIKTSLNYLAVKNDIIDKPNQIYNYTHIILPGVGSFKKAIRNLKYSGLFNSIKNVSKNKKQKILGICLGMQLLFESSTEEGLTKGLGILSGKVQYFSFLKEKNLKIPHVGFNQVLFDKNNKFYQDVKNNSDFYFDHSYRITEFKNNINPSITNYGEKFLSSCNHENIYGTQFHPEKSQSNGLLILRNFIRN